MSDLESTDLQTVGATLGFLVEGACEFGKCKGMAKGRKVRRTEEANHILEPCAELCKGVCVHVCLHVCVRGFKCTQPGRILYASISWE